MKRAFPGFLALALFAALPATSALAQTPPSLSEIAWYRGLHAAAQTGDLAAIDKLAVAGAEIDARDGHGRTPLHVATYARQRAAMQALVKRGANPRALDNQRYDTVTIAAVADDVETMRVALALGADPKAITSPYDGTALIAAAHLGHDDITRVLIDAGAPLDHVNNLGWTALIEVVVLGDGGVRHQRTARHLVSAGARRDLGDRNGVTPIQMARQRGYDAMVRILDGQ